MAALWRLLGAATAQLHRTRCVMLVVVSPERGHSSCLTPPAGQRFKNVANRARPTARSVAAALARARWLPAPRRHGGAGHPRRAGPPIAGQWAADGHPESSRQARTAPADP